MKITKYAIFCLFFLLLSAESFSGDATLSWDAPTNNMDGTPLTDLGGYKTYYGTASGTYLVFTDVGNVLTYTVTGLTNGSIYYFAVTAYDEFGNESDYSNEVYKNISATALAVPLGLQLAGGGKITVSWNSVSTASGYQVSVRSSLGVYNAILDVGTALIYTMYRLSPDTYYVKVRAYNATEFSLYSSEASVVLSADSTLPADVSNFTATVFGTGVRLSWNNPPNPDFYGLIIDYSTSTPAVWTNIASPVGKPGEKQSYDHKNLIAGNYQYRIRTKDTSGNITSTEHAYIKLQQTPVVVAPIDVVQNEPAQSQEPPKKKEKKSSGFGCGTISNQCPPSNSGTDISITLLAFILLFLLYTKQQRVKAFAR